MKFSKWNSQQGQSLICSLKYGLLKFWGSRKNYNDRQIWRNVILNLVLSEIIYHHFCGQSEFESAPRILKNVSEKSIKAVSMPPKFWCDRIKTTFWVASMAWFGGISTYLGSVARLLPFPVISEIQMPTSQNGHAHTQTIPRQQPTNCLSKFDHFVGLTLKAIYYFCNNLLS